MAGLTRRADWLRALCFIVAMGIALHLFFASPQPVSARAAPRPCKVIPDPVARAKCSNSRPHGGISIPNPISIVTGAAASAAKDIVEKALDEVTTLESHAVAAVIGEEVKFLNNASAPTMNVGWYVQQYAIILSAAIVIAIGGFAYSLVRSVWSTDPLGAGFSLMRLIGFLVFAPFVPAIVGLLAGAVDSAIVPAFLGAFGHDANTTMEHLTKSVTNWTAFTGGTAAVFLPLLYLGFGTIGGIFAILMLEFRDGMLYIVTASTAISGALFVSGAIGQGFFKKNCMMLIALIFFKAIMAFVLVVGIELFSSGSIQPIIMGAAVLIAMPLITFSAYRAISGHNIDFSPATRLATKGFNSLRS